MISVMQNEKIIVPEMMGTIFRVREEENRGTEKIERLDSAAFVIVDL